MDAIERALRQARGKEARLVLSDRLEELGREMEAAELRACAATGPARWRYGHRFRSSGGDGGDGGYGGDGG